MCVVSTGGQVFQASKAEVADLVEIIDPGSPVNSSVDLQEVGLLNIEESRAQYFSGQSYFVDIDSTLQSLVLVLTAAGSPSLDIQTVEGNKTLAIINLRCSWTSGDFTRDDSQR